MWGELCTTPDYPPHNPTCLHIALIPTINAPCFLPMMVCLSVLYLACYKCILFSIIHYLGCLSFYRIGC